MNWLTFLGEERYSRLRDYCKTHNLSIASAVRMAVDKLLKARW